MKSFSLEKEYNIEKLICYYKNKLEETNNIISELKLLRNCSSGYERVAIEEEIYQLSLQTDRAEKIINSIRREQKK